MFANVHGRRSAVGGARANKRDFIGGNDGAPQAFEDTSDGTKQSVIWVATRGGVKVSKLVKVRPGDLFFTVTTTVKNEGTVPIENVRYQRSVNPDNDFSWLGNYDTKNYVKYVPPQIEPFSLSRNCRSTSS